jgi:hypothetical protein
MCPGGTSLHPPQTVATRRGALLHHHLSEATPPLRVATSPLYSDATPPLRVATSPFHSEGAVARSIENASGGSLLCSEKDGFPPTVLRRRKSSFFTHSKIRYSNIVKINLSSLFQRIEVECGSARLYFPIQSAQILCHQYQDCLCQNIFVSTTLISLESTVFLHLCEYSFCLYAAIHSEHTTLVCGDPFQTVFALSFKLS